MKRTIRVAMVAGFWIAGTLSAQAAVPVPGAGAPRAAATVAPLNAHSLAVAESMLHYCARVDVNAAVGLRGRIDAMLKGASAAQVTGLRATAEYRTTYDAVTHFVGQVDPHNATRPCDESLAARNG